MRPDSIGVGTVLVRRYRLVSELGRGGCAVVFHAHDMRLDRHVAVKVPTYPPGDSKVNRFTRESRVIAAIHHPNVCAALDTGIADDGTPFLVMERLFGESLRSSVSHSGRLGVREAIAVGVQLLSALDAVHAAGVVHRDVKPDNIILVTRGGCDPLVKLLDFGLCRRAHRESSAAEETMTREGSILGTPEYIAPEQILGVGANDVRGDLYALGVVLYEALVGERVFYTPTVTGTLDAVLRRTVPRLRSVRRDVPSSLDTLLSRAMDRDPRNRPPTAIGFQSDLLAVKDELDRAARRAHEPIVEAWELPTTRIARRGLAKAR